MDSSFSLPLFAPTFTLETNFFLLSRQVETFKVSWKCPLGLILVGSFELECTQATLAAALDIAKGNWIDGVID